MKLRKFAFFLTMLAATVVKAQTTKQDQIVGIWESDKKDARMEFLKKGEHYYAKLLWGNLVVEPDGKTSKKDLKNPDETLRNRDILGAVTLTGLKWDGEEYTEGKAYNPTSGKTYSCKAWIEKGALKVRGYTGLSVMGKTVTWHRFGASKP